eukprot:tig00021070_g17897.t1
MRGSAQLPALHHRGLESMLAGGVRIACTFESARRTAHAQRSASSLRSILLQFDGRAAAPMLAKRPRGSGSSAAPSPLAGGLPRLHDHPVAELAQRRLPGSAAGPLGHGNRCRGSRRRALHAKRLRSSERFGSSEGVEYGGPPFDPLRFREELPLRI